MASKKKPTEVAVEEIVVVEEPTVEEVVVETTEEIVAEVEETVEPEVEEEEEVVEEPTEETPAEEPVAEEQIDEKVRMFMGVLANAKQREALKQKKIYSAMPEIKIVRN